MLFVIDDAPTMGLMQAKLAAGFPAMMDMLRALPDGVPNLRIAVVSSDMGAAGSSILGCAGSGKAGRFQFAARGSCSATNLQSDATFISDVDGVKNYTGNLEDVFRCIAPLGETGCSVEHSFAALTRALGADGKGPPPAENAGFLRRDAYLVIVMLTNRDDCSVADGIPLFDTTFNNSLASQLGPATRYRCNEFGHICDGSPPPRNAPNGMVTDVVRYQTCVSAEGNGLLKTVGETQAQINALKVDPAKQIVAVSIQAAAAPYEVHWRAASTSDTGPWPEITHSCTAADLSFGDPGVRTENLVQQFGSKGLTLPICETSFAPLMARIGEEIGRLFGAPCINRVVPKIFGTRPECNVIAHARNSNGTVVDSVVPFCGDVGGSAPCWSLIPGTGSCTGSTLDISPDPANPLSRSSTSYFYQCAYCASSMPARGCP